MRTLILLLIIAAGTGAILYFRVNLGMNWDDMSAALGGKLSMILHLAVVVAGLAATITFMSRAGQDD